MMKTVPSLVASSTVAIAAAGLALGRPEPSTPVRPSSKKRKAAELVEPAIVARGSTAPTTRSRPSSMVATPDSKASYQASGPSSAPQPSTSHSRPSTTRADSQNNTFGRRRSIVRHGDEYTEENKRDSVSSRGSWMRRFSIIPASQNESPRSSMGLDSPSLNFSHGSAAPILSSAGSSPAQLPPNKLVKRSTSGKAVEGTQSRNRSKSQVPTLRRPATSHQRSVNLQQQFMDETVAERDSAPSCQTPQSNLSSKPDSPDSRSTWIPFFDSRLTNFTKERLSGKPSDGGVQNFHSMSRRVVPDESIAPTLMKPTMITVSRRSTRVYYDEESLPFDDVMDDGAGHIQDVVPSVDAQREEPPKRARRSLSMHFSSPSSWRSRSGSFRDKKRNEEGGSGPLRNSSAPASTLPGRTAISGRLPVKSRQQTVTEPTGFPRQRRLSVGSGPHDPFSGINVHSANRSSSPLPPLSRLSSFNVDVARLALSSSSSSAPRRSPNSPLLQTNTTSTSLSSSSLVSPTLSSYFGSLNSKPPRSSEVTDRASTLIGSDNETRGFASGDEDEDFRSETVFDSLRSGATGSIRSRSIPLDAMFDESPPSVNGHSKSKRLSVHEMVNDAFGEGNNRILEEDEGMSTPVRSNRSSEEDNLQTPMRGGRRLEQSFAVPPTKPDFYIGSSDFSRLSLDDDEDDEDWTRDDENLDVNKPLSPPSSSLNSRRVSPALRAALADVTHSGSTNGITPSIAERPKSNLFDWSEPPLVEKFDPAGTSTRPKTAHVKQIADGRGGRTVGRRGPTAIHIRSQSVPVVPDLAGHREHSNLAPKFGTWGLGGKGVSEDWDGDFEFEISDVDATNDADSRMDSSSGMLVPPAIQASQANVVGHVGQIREVCLLVEDLKRLRLLAREKDLLDGASAPLWKEAEGIIALAVPDEEDPTLSPPHSPSSVVFDRELRDEKYVDRGLGGDVVSKPDIPFEVLDRRGRPTGYIYNGEAVRRRSVFSPDDDIFGTGPVLKPPPTREYLEPLSAFSRDATVRNSTEVARSVMETMHQHRSTSDPLLSDLTTQSSNKMPFDTTSLRDLVHRASVLSRTLADLIRKADGSSQSPESSPHRESSPAFTRVFTDPMASPPKGLPRSQSNNSVLSGSIDSSPTRGLAKRMQMMTVV